MIIFSVALHIMFLMESLQNLSLFRRSPCKIGQVLERNLLRSLCKFFLGGIAVMLSGVFVSYKESLQA